MKIEPLSQSHALEIANDWHYEAPYDFYDMENDPEDYEEIISPEARGNRYYQVLREGKLYGFFCIEAKRKGDLELGFEVVRRIPRESNGDIYLFVEMKKSS